MGVSFACHCNNKLIYHIRLRPPNSSESIAGIAVGCNVSVKAIQITHDACAQFRTAWEAKRLNGHVIAIHVDYLRNRKRTMLEFEYTATQRKILSIRNLQADHEPVNMDLAGLPEIYSELLLPHGMQWSV